MEHSIEILAVGICILLCAFVSPIVLFLRRVFSMFIKIAGQSYRFRILEKMNISTGKLFDENGINLITKVVLISFGLAMIIIGLIMMLKPF